MKEYIAERLSYAEIERRVREMGNYKPEISISEDGYWVIDGVKTDFKAEVGEAPVQSVNGKIGNVELSAADVGARPYNWTPSAEEVGARPDTWMPSLEDVGAEKSGTAASQVSAHNEDTSAHGNLRSVVEALKTVVDEFFAEGADNDANLDRLVEIVTLINSNKDAIDTIATNKADKKDVVLKDDIVNGLTSDSTDKPLSAAQGKAIRALLSTLQSTKLDSTALTPAINDALARAKASGAFDGEDGVGISSIAKTGSSGKVDTYTITLSNGDTATFTVTNGTNGETPVYGVDYFTPEEKAKIVTEVLEAIGTPLFGLVDENNNVVLSGKLADGSYSIKYEMENGSTVNIGNLVLDTRTYYSVTKTLTYCSINNSATKVAEGDPYKATITANDGYELKSVTVTMGGANVSVTNGVINIPSVTGNIVINAVAEEVITYAGYDVFKEFGYIDGKRQSAANGQIKDGSGYVLSGAVPLTELVGKTITVRSKDMTNTGGAGVWSIHATNSDTSSAGVVTGTISDSTLWKGIQKSYNDSGSVIVSTFEIPTTYASHYIRFSSKGSGASAQLTIDKVIS